MAAAAAAAPLALQGLVSIVEESGADGVFTGAAIYMVWTFPQPVLLAMAVSYVGSGIVIRVGGLVRRRWRGHQHPQPPPTEQHVG